MPGHGQYKGWLAIPYLSGSGHPVQIRFRCMEDHKCKNYGHGKYATIRGDGGRLFNTRTIVSAGDTIHITEGELDALSLEQCGLPAVSVPGATSWQTHYRLLLAGFRRVWIWGDPDEAGAELVNRVLRALPQAKAVPLTIGDVNDTLLAVGEAGVTELIREQGE